MSYRKKIIFLLLMTFVTFISSFLFIYPDKFGICAPNKEFTCIGPIGDKIGQPLFMGSATIFLTLLILLFTPERAYQVWKKFALVAIPLAAIWIATTPVNCGGGFGISLCFDKEAITWLASGIFLGISLIIILTTSLHKKAQ